MNKRFLLFPVFFLMNIALFGAFSTTSTTQLSLDVQSSAGVLNSSTIQSSYAPVVAMNTSGRAVAAWYRNVITATSSTSFFSNFVIQVSLFDGSTWTPNSSSSSPLELTSNVTSSYNPSVAIDSSGNVVVTWYRNTPANVINQSGQLQSTSLTVIEAKVYNASSATWSDTVVISHRGVDPTNPNNTSSVVSPWANAFNPQVELYDSGLALITYRLISVEISGANTVRQSSNSSIATTPTTWTTSTQISNPQQSYLTEFRTDSGNFQLTDSSTNGTDKAAVVWTEDKSTTANGNAISHRIVQAAILTN